MPKASIRWNEPKTNALFSAILTLKNREECAKFFRDLCTLEEITDMADRWQMVTMILQKKSYREISQKLKVSTTTVARVNWWMDQGRGGYQLAAKRLKLDTENQDHHSKSFR